jgi:dTDP-4-amino-4,6-dideoxygalactose transaminase
MTSSNHIPLLDLVTPHLQLEAEAMAVFQQVLRAAGFIGGPMVHEFEQAFAAFCDTGFAVGVSSGTDALRFALLAAGVRAGDSVLTVPNTFIATAEAITQVGAIPELIDVDEQTYNLDPNKLRQYLQTQCDFQRRTKRRISRKTSRPVTAVVPVHLYGQMADMDAIVDIAAEFGLIVVEDACQAHGAEYFSKRDHVWKKAGSIGKAAAFSFYPGKNLGACGEGGAVTTNDGEVARTVKMLRDHGQAQKYYHDIEGYNGRLDALQAGLLSLKLRHLAEWNQQRRGCAASYHTLLSPLADAIGIPFEPSWSRASYHLYVVRHGNREALQAHLGERGIGTGIHYPVPLHLQKAYQHLGCRSGDFPVSEMVSREVLSLPMYPHLRADLQKTVADAITEFVHSTRHVRTMTAGAAFPQLG